MTRKRRTREETRELLLDAAVRVVLARSNGDHGASTNPLAGVRITDALEEVNRVLRELDPDATEMTTGAVYNIWPSQEDFQMALLDKVLTDAAVPGIDRVKAALDEGLRDGADWRELVVRCFGVDFEASYQAPTMFLMIGMTALAPAERLAAMNVTSNERYVAETGEIVKRILRHGGRKMAPGRSIADLVWAIEALESGYLLRRRSFPDVTSRRAGGRTVVQAAILALVEEFTVETAPTNRP
jgi:AcrR family transcriptional regulator